MRSFFILSIMFLLPILIYGSNIGQITGKVYDVETGNVIPYTNVIIRGTNLQRIVDLNGEFTFENIQPGNYTVIASLIGYTTVEENVFVAPGRKATLNFNLLSNPIRMEGIVVTGTRTPRYIKDAPVRTEVITTEMMSNKGAANLYETLEGAQGIRVEEQCAFCNFSMIRLQGLGPDHTQVLIDGQPIYSGLASIYGLQQIGTADIDHIEIVKGAGSSLYGSSAVAGAINIITKKPAAFPDIGVTMQYGSFNTYNFSFNGSMRYNNIGILLSGQKHGGDPIDRSGDNGDEVDDITDRVETDATNLAASIIVSEITGDDEIIIGVRTINELREGGILTDNLYKNPFTEGTERILTDRFEGNMRYKKYFGQIGQLNLNFTYSNHNRNATNDGFLGDYMATHNDSLPSIDQLRPYIAEEQIYAFDINYMYRINPKNSLIFGIQLSHSNVDESGKYIVIDEEDSLYGTSFTSTSNKFANEIGIYVQNEFMISDKFEIVAGLRYDYHRSEDNFRGSGKLAQKNIETLEYEETAISPRLALKYALNSDIVFRGSVGTGFRVPFGFSEDLHLCSGSPSVWKGDNLKPEKSISYNFSLDWSFGLNNEFGISLFRTDLKDMIGYVEAGEKAKNLGYSYEWMNVDNAYVQGVEFSTMLQLSRFFVLNGDFTYNDGQYENTREDWNGTEFESNSKYISRIPRYTAGLGFDMFYNSWHFVLGSDYQGSMYIDYFADDENPTEIFETDPFVTFDAQISKKFFDKFKIYVGGNNLTDYIQPVRHMDDAAFIYAPLYGRELYAGFSINL